MGKCPRGQLGEFPDISWEEIGFYEKILDDPTPMPESALLMATAQIMAEGGAKHSPVNCNTPNSKLHLRGRAPENTSQK